jgi:hypothetical protein
MGDILEDHHRQLVQITNWLRVFIAPGQVTELRALEVSTDGYRRPHTESGYFDYDHLEDMASAALTLCGQDAKGVYFAPNPLLPDLLARRFNRVAADARDTATDGDVLKRRWLLIDIDPQRLGGISATDAEKAKALEKAMQVRTFLQQQGWPAPVLADSGNGYHLLYRIDLPADDGGLVQRVLQALAERFDDEFVKIDRVVYNPGRIVRVYGTRSCKGDDTPERPHRWTQVLEVPA